MQESLNTLSAIAELLLATVGILAAFAAVVVVMTMLISAVATWLIERVEDWADELEIRS